MKQIQTSTDNIEEFAERQNRTIAEFLQQRKEELLQKGRELMEWHRPVTKEHFWMMLQASAKRIMAKRGEMKEYVCDEEQAEIFNQLYLYLIASPECKMDVNKGIYMMGSVGCGKSLLMSAFCDVQAKLCGKIIENIHAKVLAEDIEKNGVDKYVKKALMIDDIGRETSEINKFGKKVRPISDLFEQRYEHGTLTFCTSNFRIESLAEDRKTDNGTVRGYGNYIKTRMEAMMNIVNLPGKNKRTSNIL